MFTWTMSNYESLLVVMVINIYQILFYYCFSKHITSGGIFKHTVVLVEEVLKLSHQVICFPGGAFPSAFSCCLKKINHITIHFSITLIQVHIK